MRSFVRGRRVLTPEGLRSAVVWIQDGRVELVGPYEPTDASRTLDAGELCVLPGLVDCHVHVNQPGRTEWEGFETATRAAAAGGVTTIIDMPLNSRPVTTTVSALQTKRRAAERLCAVDVGFWGGVVPGNEGELEAMAAAGIFGFKCFLIDSGIPDFPPVGETELSRAMEVLARLGLPLLVHAELACCAAPAAADRRRYGGYLASRPKAWENEAVALVARLSRRTGCRVHIVHLSSAEALPAVAAAKKDGAPLTAETCPHYLCLSAEEVPDGRTEFKCAPPIREADNREKLWQALEDGTLDFIVSDHSPCSPDLKKRESGDFSAAWGGISSLQLGLAAVWTEARRRGIPLARVARWMSEAPARLCGLEERKGGLLPGCDADFILFDPDAAWTVEESALRHRHKLTPYLGRALAGRVAAAYLRGERVFQAADPDGPPRGRLVSRSPAHGLHRTH